MNNLFDFFDWKINENSKKQEDKNNEIEIDNDNGKNNITINNSKYIVDKTGDITKDNNEPVTKAEKKYVSTLSDSAENAIDYENSYEMDRLTGGIKDLKNGVVGSKILNDKTYKETKDTFIKAINGLDTYEYKYFKYSDFENGNIGEDNIKDIFSIKTKGIGRGEVLLPVFFGDVRRKNLSDKGDDAIIGDNDENKEDIEVKSAGTPMQVKIPKDKTELTKEYICAYSIARYIMSRNLGQLYLVFFDNKFKQKEESGILNDEENSENEKTDTSNKLGKEESNGFLIMNCGITDGKRTGTSIDSLAKELSKIVEVEYIDNNRKDIDKFVMQLNHNNDTKIVCYINGKKGRFEKEYNCKEE